MTEAEEALLRAEFDRRALANPRLEYRHPAIMEKVFDRVQVARAERSLDIGCGSGWATRRLAQMAPEGLAVGMDISAEMIRLARRLSVALENCMFVSGVADEIPWQEDFFSLALSVDSAFYWPDPAAAASEIRRVLSPGGRLVLLLSYFRENPMHGRWQSLFRVPVHLKAAAEWAGIVADAGFEAVRYEQITDQSPVEPDFAPSEFYPTPEDKLAFRRAGALLIEARKPALQPGPQPPAAPRTPLVVLE